MKDEINSVVALVALEKTKKCCNFIYLCIYSFFILFCFFFFYNRSPIFHFSSSESFLMWLETPATWVCYYSCHQLVCTSSCCRILNKRRALSARWWPIINRRKKEGRRQTERREEEHVTLFCLACGNWSTHQQVIWRRLDYIPCFVFFSITAGYWHRVILPWVQIVCIAAKLKRRAQQQQKKRSVLFLFISLKKFPFMLRADRNLSLADG